MSATDKPVIAIVLPADRRGRRRMCRLAAKLHKGRIEPITNGKFQVKVRLGSYDDIQLVGETRQAVSRAIDEFFKLLAGPRTALQVHRYFRRLEQRAQAGGFQSAGDLFTGDGTITNLDTVGPA
jgi:hypothetical protein